jgi:L-threonylcarbamoyladenylate synthase
MPDTNTTVVQVDRDHPDPAHMALAGGYLRNGHLVAFPTETVYGLGAHALNRTSVRRLFDVKGRPAHDPVIVHVSSLAQVVPLVQTLPEIAHVLAARFWPGPLTLVLPRSPQVPDEVTAGLETVGVRIPSHPVALALLTAAGVPVAAPSANLFSRPSPTTATHVLQDLDGRIDLVLDAGPTQVGVESTVLDLSRHPPVVLRPGAVTLDALRAVVPQIEETGGWRPVDAVARPSPGLLEKHYSPRAPLTLYEGHPVRVIERLMHDARVEASRGRSVGVLAADEDNVEDPALQVVRMGPERDPAAIARRLYSALREIDAAGVDVILVRGFPAHDGLGIAVADRLRRAAAGRIVRC